MAKLDSQTIELIATTPPEDIVELLPDLLSEKAKRELIILQQDYIWNTAMVWDAITPKTKNEIIEAAQEL